MKVAQFSTGADGHKIIHDEQTGNLMSQYHRYVRLTEYVDIEFPPLPAKEVVEGQLQQLQEAEQELREKFQQKLNEIAEARAKLLSLTHDVQS